MLFQSNYPIFVSKYYNNYILNNMKYPFISAEEAAAIIHNGNTIGIGGFSSVGTPKAVPEALARYAEKLHAEGKEFKVGLITGGATGCQVDSALAQAHAVAFRTPFQSN